MTREIIRVHKDTKQTLVDIIRDYPAATLRYDDTTYAKPVYHLYSGAKMEGMFIREELIQTIYKLTDGMREITVAKLRDVSQRVEVK